MYKAFRKLLCSIGWHRWQWEYVSTDTTDANEIPDHARCIFCNIKYKDNK